MACKNLESKGTITRSDGYQEILNSIANDIRTKNRKQIQRAKDLKSMQNALEHLEEKKTGLEEQIQMYKTHNAQSISNMQDKGYVRRSRQEGEREVEADLVFLISWSFTGNEARFFLSPSSSGIDEVFVLMGRCPSTVLGFTSRDFS